MKRIGLLVMMSVSLSFTMAQSQKITGIILPKPGKSISFFPDRTEGMDTVAKVEQPVVTTQRFIIQPPIKQGGTNKSATVTEPIVVQPINTTKTVSNKPSTTSLPPLEYGPPTTNVNVGNNGVSSSTSAASLTYGPPPTLPSKTLDGVKKTSSGLVSPKIEGLITAKAKQSIVFVPIPALKEENDNKEEKKVEKSIVDLYPPTDYAPPPAEGSTLQAVTITGSHAATLNKSIVFVPIAAATTFDSLEFTHPPTAADSIAEAQALAAHKPDNNVIETKVNAILPTSQQAIYTPVDNTKAVTTAAIKPVVDNVVTANSSISNTSSPTKKTKKAKNKPIIISPPVKQDMAVRNADNKTALANNNFNTTTTSNQALVSPVNNSINAGIYKVYVTNDGKFTVLFSGEGNNVTVTHFGRVTDFTTASPTLKPNYNYRGLIDAVGSLPLQYTYEGRVASVGKTDLNYNYNGAIDKIGQLPVYYNSDGKVEKIGNTKITYDYQGNLIGMDNNNPLVTLK